MSVDFIIGQEGKEIAGHTTDKEYIWDYSGRRVDNTGTKE